MNNKAVLVLFATLSVTHIEFGNCLFEFMKMKPSENGDYFINEYTVSQRTGMKQPGQTFDPLYDQELGLLQASGLVDILRRGTVLKALRPRPISKKAEQENSLVLGRNNPVSPVPELKFGVLNLISPLEEALKALESVLPIISESSPAKNKSKENVQDENSIHSATPSTQLRRIEIFVTGFPKDKPDNKSYVTEKNKGQKHINLPGRVHNVVGRHPEFKWKEESRRNPDQKKPVTNKPVVTKMKMTRPQLVTQATGRVLDTLQSDQTSATTSPDTDGIISLFQKMFSSILNIFHGVI